MAFLENAIRKKKWFLFLGLLVGATTANGQPSPEYRLKAVFIYNFTQFVNWPADAFASEDAPLVIGILGDDPFGSHLDETIRNENANGHPLVVVRAAKLEDMKDCHILFISPAGSGLIRDAIRDTTGKPVLTISDASNFVRNGGVIRLYTENNKIRIRINLDAARENKLTISSKLLKLADVVESKRN